MEKNILYQAAYYSFGRSVEIDLAEFFSNKKKAIDWCKEMSKRMAADIDVTPKANLFIVIREYHDNDGQYIHHSTHRFEWYVSDKESKTDRQRNRYHYGMYPEEAVFFTTD